MKVINLRDIYPHYTQDYFVEVTDEVADLFSEFDNKEAAYRLYFKAFISRTPKS